MTFSDRVFRHPYLYSGSVLAKACTLLATVIWSASVLWHPHALAYNPNYTHLLHLIPTEDTWAWIFLGVVAPLTWRLYSCTRPHLLNVFGYAVLTLLWCYLWWGFVISGLPQPGALSSSTVVMLLSLYAFIANPRVACPTCGGPRDSGMYPLTGKPCGNARRFDELRGKTA